MRPPPGACLSPEQMITRGLGGERSALAAFFASLREPNCVLALSYFTIFAFVIALMKVGAASQPAPAPRPVSGVGAREALSVEGIGEVTAQRSVVRVWPRGVGCSRVAARGPSA